MANVIINDTNLTNIANAIREKNGSTDTYMPSEMADAIAAIETGGGGAEDTRFYDIIARTITEIDDDTITTVGKYAFNSCAELKTINLPNCTTIGNSAFSNTMPTTVNLPKVTTVGEYAFQGSGHYEYDLDLPAVTSLGNYNFNVANWRTVRLPSITVIPERGFYNSYVTVVDIGPNCTWINNYGFYGASALKALIFRRTESIVTTGSSNIFNNSRIKNGYGYIYVPSALIEAYKAESMYSGVSPMFRAIEDYTLDGTVTGEMDYTKIVEEVE